MRIRISIAVLGLALAGPAVNVVLAAGLYLGLALGRGPEPVGEVLRVVVVTRHVAAGAVVTGNPARPTVTS